MKLLKISAVTVTTLLIVSGAAYGGYVYGHGSGYKSAQVIASKQISALRKQDSADKAQADKYKQQMWDAISSSTQSNSRSASPSLHCTSSTYGIYGQYTNTNCN